MPETKSLVTWVFTGKTKKRKRHDKGGKGAIAPFFSMRKKLLCLIIISSIIGECLAVCLCVSIVPVYALSAGGLKTTIASIIVSLLMQTGTAPINESWVTTLNTAYGVESTFGTVEDMISSGLLTETAEGLIDSGLSSAIESSTAYSTLGLGDLFTTTVTDEAVVAASGGVNIAKSTINAGTLGTIGAYAGAATIGVGVGVLARKVYEKYKDFIQSGLSIEDQLCPNLSNYACHNVSNYVSTHSGSAIVCYDWASDEKLVQVLGDGTSYFVNLNDNSVTCYYYQSRNAGSTWMYPDNWSVNPNTYKTNPYGYFRRNLRGNGVKFATNAEAEAYAQKLLTGEELPPAEICKDLVGKNGNYTDNNEDLLGIGNVVPDGYDMIPIPMEDYIDFVNDAIDNVENGDTGVEQGDLFDNLITPFLEKPSMVPDQGIVPPVVDDRVPIPEQPIIPQKDPVTGEEIDSTLAGAATPDLTKVFPFCIPFDLYAMFSNLKYETREAPVIVWEFPLLEYLGNPSGWKIEIDLSKYDEAAEIFRRCELLLFIVGLAVATKNFLYGVG